MLQTRLDNTSMTPRTGRFLGIQLLGFLFVLSCLSFGPAALANHKTPPEAASPQSQESPTATPTPTEEELKLQQEKKILDMKKDIEADKQAIAESQKAQLEAKFPKPTTSPLAGTTTMNDGAVIESQIVSYVSMAKAAEKIIAGINTHQKEVKNLAVYNERDINLFLSYKVATNQIASLKGQYCRVLAPTQKTVPPCPPPTGVKFVGPELLGIPASFLGAFVDFTALLRTNVDIKGMSFDIDEGPLVAEVFRAARKVPLKANVNLYYPYVFPPDRDPASESTLLKRLEDVHTLRIIAGKLVSDLEKTSGEIDESETTIKQLTRTKKAIEKQEAETESAINNLFRANYCPKLAEQSIDILEKVGKVIKHRACTRMPAEKREWMLQLAETVKDLRYKVSKAQSDLAEETTNLTTLNTALETLKKNLSSIIKPDGSLEDALAQLKAFNAQFDGLVKSLIDVDAASGANPLTNYIRVENLMSVLPLTDSYWLQLKVLKAGGNNRIKTNLITDIFTAGNRVSHSGGVIVQYHLFDASGRSVASDTITEYTNYIKANKIKDLPLKEKVDETP